jgi:glycine C-acetyltransferase
MLRPISSVLTTTGPADTARDYARAPHPIPVRGGEHVDPRLPLRTGLDFTRQDYLSLASHPAIRVAAFDALGQHRHDASASPLRWTQPVAELEHRLAAFLQVPRAVVFPTATDAIRITLCALLAPGDEVIVDTGANPAMFDTVLFTGATLHRTPAGSVEGVERRLSRLARQPRCGRLFLVVPAIAAQTSRMADLAELASLARENDALLIADVTHDFGSMGQAGLGVMEIQGCLGRVDVVVGSFAQCFGAQGGFAAFRNPAHGETLHLAQWRPAPLSPVNAGTILAALDIIDSPEGRRRRRRLHGNALRLRNHLMADHVRVMGQPSPFVTIRLPISTALPRTALLESAGPRVILLQAPAVPIHAPRWRIQLCADHGSADIDDLAELIRDVMRAFDNQTRPVQPPATP